MLSGFLRIYLKFPLIMRLPSVFFLQASRPAAPSRRRRPATSSSSDNDDNSSDFASVILEREDLTDLLSAVKLKTPSPAKRKRPQAQTSTTTTSDERIERIELRARKKRTTPVKGLFEKKGRGKNGQEKEDELVLDEWEVLEDEPDVRPPTTLASLFLLCDD